MEIMEIKKYPNDDVLRKICEPVNGITQEESELFDRMLYTMRYFKGIGLAAPQIGLSKRMIIAEVDNKVIKLANPKVINKKGKDKMIEGCLSIPDTSVDVKRSYSITAVGLNEKGDEVELDLKGLLARVVLHEIDHLDGKLIVDYMNFLKKWKYKKSMKM